MIQFDEHIFQIGWNHQRENMSIHIRSSMDWPCVRVFFVSVFECIEA